jgi:hypothetical protein
MAAVHLLGLSASVQASGSTCTAAAERRKLNSKKQAKLHHTQEQQ